MTPYQIERADFFGLRLIYNSKMFNIPAMAICMDVKSHFYGWLHIANPDGRNWTTLADLKPLLDIMKEQKV
jgi:hypothetical protein